MKKRTHAFDDIIAPTLRERQTKSQEAPKRKIVKRRRTRSTGFFQRILRHLLGIAVFGAPTRTSFTRQALRREGRRKRK